MKDNQNEHLKEKLATRKACTLNSKFILLQEESNISGTDGDTRPCDNESSSMVQ